ncbi:Maf family protein [Oleiagrimonas sp. C23AA]|uniref:Maf family protein n=1 Tax=Oleiagrimonas sp. C23AA TaxID=2719047 RepID=UPI0014230E52|nr:Maf family protein [Oleiagrimonas sp. C23AA]NII10092.1 septum formation inhibitor Maf [Oleiagrimonas sp. C23AA]
MLFLASKSPRRRELLGQLGVDFEVIEVDVPEVRAAEESSRDYVARVSADKADAGLARAQALHPEAACWAIGSDTEVVLGDQVLGKPADTDDARAMLRRLSGRTHQVVSAVWLVGEGFRQHEVCVSEVRFDPLDEARIEAYVATGESFGKAGAYAIQGRAAAFAAHLSGSYSAVMGLPLHATARLLREAGLGVL